LGDPDFATTPAATPATMRAEAPAEDAAARVGTRILIDARVKASAVAPVAVRLEPDTAPSAPVVAAPVAVAHATAGWPAEALALAAATPGRTENVTPPRTRMATAARAYIARRGQSEAIPADAESRPFGQGMATPFGSSADSRGVPWLCGPASRRVCRFVVARIRSKVNARS
jgi:hypothetical protein